MGRAAPSITLLIPTMNRSEFVIRLLCYYRDLEFRGQIFIADSSEGWHADKVKSAIGPLGARIKVAYKGQPRLNNAQCIKNLLTSVSTPYVALVPDDDFLVPGGLEECIEFLERSPDYMSAHGLGFLFTVDSDGAHGQVESVVPYGLRPMEGKTASERLFAHLTNYSVTLFSVHRTETMRAMYEYACGLGDKIFETEMIPCCLSAVLGKSKGLNCLYLARQAHGRRTRLPDVFEWVTQPDWSATYQLFRDCLARELVRQDGLSIDEATKAVDRAFCSYLVRHMADQWKVAHGLKVQRFLLSLRQWARSIPGLPKLWHKARSLLPGDDHQISLERLMKTSSLHHGDFMAVRRAITMAPAPVS